MFAFAIAAMIDVAPTVAQTEGRSVKILVNHAPKGVYETLEKVDNSSLLATSLDGWFSPSEADVWVYFVSSPEDQPTLPEIGRQVFNGIADRSSGITRTELGITNGRTLSIQIKDLSKVSRSANFQGCVSALDVASVVYVDFILSLDKVKQYCSDY